MVKKHLRIAQKYGKSTRNLNERIGRRISRIEEILDRGDEINAEINSDRQQIEFIRTRMQQDFNLAEAKVASIEKRFHPEPQYLDQPNQKKFTPYYIAAAATVVGLGCIAAMIITSDNSNIYDDFLETTNNYPKLSY